MDKVVSVINSNRFSDIMQDIGQVLFASVFLQPLIDENTSWVSILSGLFATLFFWSLTLRNQLK